jgi:Kdo2-lipid IVA lauroyltransferase/acyltransferase
MKLMRKRREIADVNLQLCFPEKSPAELARAHHEALGIGVFETGIAWWADSRRLPPCRIVG